MILYFILGLIVFLLVLGIIVIIHEGGHFFFAKKAGILCHEFSVGMGPLIAQKKKGETMYSIRAIPLGGYVSMAGEEVESDIFKPDGKTLIDNVKLGFDKDGHVCQIVLNVENEKYKDLKNYKIVSYDLNGTLEALPNELWLEAVDEETGEQVRFTVNRDCMVNIVKKEEIQIAPKDRVFCNKPIGKRFISIFGGPMMNFILALIIFFAMGLIFGYSNTNTRTIGEITNDDYSNAAYVAGIEQNDDILMINGHTINDWNDLQVVMNGCAIGEINPDGGVEIAYHDDSENEDKIVIAFPKAYVMSSQLICEYNDGVVIINDKETFSDSLLGKAGLAYNDKIIGIVYTNASGEEKEVLVDGIDDLLKFFGEDINSETTKSYHVSKVKYRVQRDSQKVLSDYVEVYSKDILDSQNYPQTKVILGISPKNHRNVLKLIYMPWIQTGDAATQVFKTLRLLFKKNSGVNITDLSGPVGIFNLFTQLVQGDDALYNILYWSGLISVNIGLVNLFPLPALDGGRLAFLIYEAITKKKPTPKVENTIHNIGFILLMGLFVFVFVSDIIKCF